ncbi:RNase adapter RapZ [Nocardiopsis alba]|uniref:RapZ C-terminal domain-containing protein n=1 Tax=Nocardiopsis alba TaxID=53437 RepID=UPI0033F2A4B7
MTSNASVITSFGYRHEAGVPAGADLVVDLRHRLYNPPEDPKVKAAMVAATGLEPHVHAYVMDTDGAEEVIAEILAAMDTLRGRVGRPLRVAIGCQGGRHRSVVIASEVAAATGATVVHRDVTLPVIR